MFCDSIRGEDLFILKFASLTIKEFPCFEGEILHTKQMDFNLTSAGKPPQKVLFKTCTAKCDLNCKSMLREEERKIENRQRMKSFKPIPTNILLQSRKRKIGMSDTALSQKLNSSRMARAGEAHLAYRGSFS